MSPRRLLAMGVFAMGLLACGDLFDDPVAPPTRVVVVGIDGGDWDLFDPLIEEGLLPNLGRLRKEGATGPIKVDSAQSPESWTTLATGVYKERHGIVQDTSRPGSTFAAHPSQIKVKRLWDIAGERGRRIFVADYWVTRPAYPVNGVLISREGNESYPPGSREVRGRRLSPKNHRKKMADLGLEFSVSDTMTGWLDRDPNFDLAILPYYGWDQSLHVLFQEFSTWRDPVALKGTPAKALDRVTTGGQIVLEAAKVADRLLGRGLRYAGDDGYVVVWSDHGHRAATPCRRRIAYRRAVLEDRRSPKDPQTIEEGSLMVRGAQLTLASREVTWYGRLRNLACILKFPVIDIQGDEAEAQLTRLEALALESGEPLFHRVGNSLRPSQALQELGAETLAKETNDLFSVFVNSGSHGVEDDGIFGVLGPGVQAGPMRSEVRTVDTTPTVLWLMGLPTAEDMDGRPITDILTPSALQDRPVTTVPTFEDGVRPWATPEQRNLSETEIERLKALGYIDG